MGRASEDQAAGGVWVFAYGSLMWNPGFVPVETSLAHLYGWHRSLCILSHYYRGTVANPGLVLGLDRGGSCVGRAFRVDPQDWPQIWEQLNAREMISNVYVPRIQRIKLQNKKTVCAYVFTANRAHSQYWSGSEGKKLELILNGCGSMGSSRQYLEETVKLLLSLGIRDRSLLSINSAVQGRTSL
jgi:glutathione-specific gamma-glutamylcyclotransferase